MSRLWPKRKWENTQWHKSNRVKIERQFCRKRKADRTNRAQMQSAKTIVNKLNFVTRFSLENLSTKSILCRNTISVLLISQIISPLWKKKIEKSKFHQRNYRFGTASKFYLLSFSPWRYLFFYFDSKSTKYPADNVCCATHSMTMETLCDALVQSILS